MEENEYDFQVSVVCFIINLIIIFYYLTLILFFNYKENVILEIIFFSNVLTSIMFVLMSLVSEKLDKNTKGKRYK